MKRTSTVLPLARSSSLVSMMKAKNQLSRLRALAYQKRVLDEGFSFDWWMNFLHRTVTRKIVRLRVGHKAKIPKQKIGNGWVCTHLTFELVNCTFVDLTSHVHNVARDRGLAWHNCGAWLNTGRMYIVGMYEFLSCGLVKAKIYQNKKQNPKKQNPKKQNPKKQKSSSQTQKKQKNIITEPKKTKIIITDPPASTCPMNTTFKCGRSSELSTTSGTTKVCRHGWELY